MEQQPDKEIYCINDVVPFKVKNTFDGYCELCDEKNGITAYLQGTRSLNLFKGQVIECRVKAVSKQHPVLELVNMNDYKDDGKALTKKAAEILKGLGAEWEKGEFTKLLIDERNTNSQSIDRWIQGLLNRNVDLSFVRTNCSDFLERTDFLNICKPEEREFYQEKMTCVIEQLGYYIKAARLIRDEQDENADERQSTFINNLLEKLRLSGYIYHPNKNFNILSCMFLQNPDIMDSCINELITIICSREISTWKKEPFRSALINILELYIRESKEKVDRTRDNKYLVNSLMRALSIQLMLAKNAVIENADADMSLSKARLCTISSYYPSVEAARLIDSAFYMLFASESPVLNYSINDITSDVVPYIVCNTAIPSETDSVSVFSKGQSKLTISKEGVSLYSNKKAEGLFPVFPKELKLWKNLQIYTEEKTGFCINKNANDITPYVKLWNTLELTFFDFKLKTAENATSKKKKHRIEDNVTIYFVRQDPLDVTKYYCRIDDETGGEGFIYVSEILPYSASTSLRYFISDKGNRLIYEAHIIDEVEGLFRFSMADELKEWAQGYYDDDDEIICSIGRVLPNGSYAPAISLEGISISLINMADWSGLSKNSVVKCRKVSNNKDNFHINCKITGYTSYAFDLNSAIRTLLDCYAVDELIEGVDEAEEEKELIGDRILDASYVKELVSLIDRQAFIGTDYIKSFNYLGFARLLSLMVGSESQAEYYKGRMDIISMLYSFASSSRIDEEGLDKLSEMNDELYRNNDMLGSRFKQLKVISYMGKKEYNEELFRLSAKYPEHEELAGLVIAYNNTYSARLEKASDDIKNRIMQKLRLKGFESGLKKYGTGVEDDITEYKASMVFYNGERSKFPNPQQQMDVIMQTINAFLNSKGGTLYLGVNDYGMGIGLEDDLNTNLYYGSKDKYVRSLMDNISSTWGKLVSTLVEANFDMENEDKDVLVVHVNPYPDGVSYNGLWYVRTSNSKRSLDKMEFDKYQKLNRRLPSADTKKDVIIPEPVTEQAAEKKSKPKTKLPKQELDNEYAIRTSRIRKNVLTEYDDAENYVPPIFFFKFLDGCKIQKMEEYDYDTKSSMLTLAVLEPEEHGYMVLGYENGHVAKIPIDTTKDFGQGSYSRYDGSKLIFATIAGGGDAVLTITVDKKPKSKPQMRLDHLKRFDPVGLGDNGECLFNENLIGTVLAYDVIPSRYLGQLEAILDKPKTYVGAPATQVNKPIVDVLHLLGIKDI